MQRTRIEDGNPTVETAQYCGYAVRVVSAYYVVEDVYLVHLYIAPPGGPEVKVFDPARREGHLEDALDLGFAAAKLEIDQLVGDADRRAVVD